MKIFFVTGNKNKYAEATKAIPFLGQMNIDLPEIQSLDVNEVVKYKLEEAKKNTSSNLLVEDVSLEIESLNNLPGPLIKWFNQALGPDKLSKLAIGSKAVNKCSVGLLFNGNIQITTEETHGTVVEPRGESGFGFDPIFIPEGADKTYAEMSMDEKRRYSPREKAFKKVKRFLDAKRTMAMVFGTFDVVHPGHLNFFKQAKEHADKLVVVIARSDTIKKIKGKRPMYESLRRLKDVRKSVDVDDVILGSLEDKYEAIRKLRPDVICLGHDQESFVKGLEELIKEQNLPTKVVRLKPYKRHKYSSSLIKENLKKEE